MIVKIMNPVHDTTKTFTIKDYYGLNGSDDILEALEREIFNNGKDMRYAKSKIKEMISETCTNGNKCTCAIFAPDLIVVDCYSKHVNIY